MLPLFSARTRRISKINSCLRMPVAPAMSSSLAILVSAEMLISFIAESEMLWAGGAGGAVWAGAAVFAGACLPAGASAGLPAGTSAGALAAAEASAGAGAVGVAVA